MSENRNFTDMFLNTMVAVFAFVVGMVAATTLTTVDSVKEKECVILKVVPDGSGQRMRNFSCAECNEVKRIVF